MPPTLEEFTGTSILVRKIGWSINKAYTPVTLLWLEQFLAEHPDAFIVTDLKSLKLFPRLAAHIVGRPQASQFIFQAYSFDHIDYVRKLDAKAKVIFTLYRSGKTPRALARISDYRTYLWGITLPMRWAADRGMLESLREQELPLFLHGSPGNINSNTLHLDFAARGIAGFYLD